MMTPHAKILFVVLLGSLGAFAAAGPIEKRSFPNFIKDLSGAQQTAQFSAGATDLGIPVIRPDGKMLFICGDTFIGKPGGSDWRAPTGLISSNANLNGLNIDSSVGGSHANGLVPESHNGGTTAIPSDVFRIGNTLYMNLMRGVIYQTDHSDFWKSTDNGNTWQYLNLWEGSLVNYSFQQKTFAVADDGYVYVLSTVFNRDIDGDLVLHRVPQSQIETPSAWQPWGYNNGWAWGNQATSIYGSRRWGEISFRQINGRFVLSYFSPEAYAINCLIFNTPTDDLFNVQEQTMLTGGALPNLYGGFIFPGATLDNLDISVSQWPNDDNYRFSQWRITGLNY